ncbi:protease [Tenericutes bacterium MZ-XQ]|nr:protease [Tenericutes bacterium MZ-XQ]
MKKIAILVADYFEDNELFYPYFRLQEAGFDVDLVGAKANETYKSKHNAPAVSNVASKDVSSKDYVAVIIPGGYSPDHMRRSKETVDFVKAMSHEKKLIAAICHGPWMMASACDLKGRTLTGYYSIKDDLVHAGATYVDQEVAVDDNYITSRTPKDLPAFLKAILNYLA